MTPKVTKTMMLVATILTGIVFLVYAFAFLGPNAGIIRLINSGLRIDGVTFFPPVIFMLIRLILTVIACAIVYSSSSNNKTKFITSLVMLLIIEVSSLSNSLLQAVFYQGLSVEEIAGVSAINTVTSIATFVPAAAILLFAFSIGTLIMCRND